MAAEGGWQNTENAFRDLQSASRNPQLLQEIATSVSDKGKPLPETSSQ
jgi:hypothetical protein